MAEVKCIQIATATGPMLLPIIQTVGPFSIHRTAARLIGFTVTHTASGYGVGPSLASVADAVRMAQELAVAADWGFKDPKAVKRWSRYRTDKVKRVVKQFAPTPEASQK